MLRKVWTLIWTVLVCACASSGAQGGVHAKFAYIEGHALRVVSLPAQGPAYRAGLRSDDRVIQIDQAWVSDLTLKEAVEKLRGPVGSKVQLKVRRDQQTLNLDVERSDYAQRRR